MRDDAEREKRGAAALAKVKVDAKADIAIAPHDGVYANMMGRRLALDDVSMVDWEGK